MPPTAAEGDRERMPLQVGERRRRAPQRPRMIWRADRGAYEVQVAVDHARRLPERRRGRADALDHHDHVECADLGADGTRLLAGGQELVKDRQDVLVRRPDLGVGEEFVGNCLGQCSVDLRRPTISAMKANTASPG